MKIYLVEIVSKGHLEVFSTKKKWIEAHNLVVGKEGLVTEMELSKCYPEGVGVCQHWHYGDEGEGIEDDRNCWQCPACEYINPGDVELCMGKSGGDGFCGHPNV